MESYSVVCASGTLRAGLTGAVHFPHRWTEAGVEASAPFTGAHLLHLAVAGCVLNDLHREAEALGVRLDGVRVHAEGGFGEDWASSGISYRVELDTRADAARCEQLLAAVDAVAEIPRAVRAGTTVRRTG